VETWGSNELSNSGPVENRSMNNPYLNIGDIIKVKRRYKATVWKENGGYDVGCDIPQGDMYLIMDIREVNVCNGWKTQLVADLLYLAKGGGSWRDICIMNNKEYNLERFFEILS